MAAPGGLTPLAANVQSRVEMPGGPLVVALSGGADSAVLAWVAVELSGTVRAVFVDHGLEASHRLRAAAGGIAAALDIALDVIEAPVARGEPSFEDVAREARYSALMTAAKPDEFILTGHTADDQAETVLGNFLRGAGAAGLAGIPSRRGRIVRPLLGVTREETRRLAGELALPFVDDPENQSADARRNRLRNQLIPHLEATYNPQLRSVLGRTAAVLAADDAALEAEAARVPVQSDGEVVWLPATLLAVLPAVVAARAVRRALRDMRGPHAGSHDEVTAVRQVAASGRAGAELASGVRAEREGPMVVLSVGDLLPADPEGLELPSEVRFDRWYLRFTISESAPSPRPLGTRTLTLDSDAVGTSLVIRSTRPEDRIDIGTGSKPVRQAMAERGVPRRLRGRWPVVAWGDRVVAIPGVRAAAWARPSASTVRYLVAYIETTGTGSSAEGT